MKKASLLIVVIISTAAVLFSCKKELSCEGCANKNKPPIANAGKDSAITLPADSILLDGILSTDPDGKIIHWKWTEVSGSSSVVINNAVAAKTIAKNLAAGVYQFELTVTDNGGLSSRDTLQINVNPSIVINHSPVANAGNDTTINLPVSTANLDGSKSSDPDNNITAYQWTEISGPASFTIVNANSAKTQVVHFVEGVYQFELQVTDAGGLLGKDTVQVTVTSQPSPPPPCTTNCNKIVFVSNRDGNDEIYTCNADGSNVARLTNDPAADGQPVWSPDGTRIAFVRMNDLYIMNADGSSVVRKTFSGCNYPAWSPDGKKIVYSEKPDLATISIMNLTSGSVAKLPNMYGSSVTPSAAWSPDGTKIAFDSDWNAWDFISDIFTISPDGSAFTLLTKTFFNDSDYWRPAWSPNGTKLSVTLYQMNSIVEHKGSIAVMNADGSGLTIIKTGVDMTIWNETRTAWSPDGTRIAYTDNKTVKWVAADGSASGTIVANGWDADWKH
ncbi:MAG: PKD domain-containing protein [Flavisolibacter sp.]